MTTALDALDGLTAGIAAARTLGLDVDRAEALRSEASERLGIAPDVYVLALVGGTGVGKSTILNALAGATVSEAGARRPTTSRPVAWLPAGLQDEAGAMGLIRRLDAQPIHQGGAGDLGNVVVLDLPDIDSLEASHREAVEAVLPKADAVAWVTDPEKYADAVLHDAFLRDWLPRLGRQIVVLNKVDRLDPGALRSVEADLAGVLRRELPSAGSRSPEIVATTAAAGPDGVAALRGWLQQAADAKAIVAERLVAGASAALGDLAGRAGVSGGQAMPFLPEPERKRTVDAAVTEVLRVIDLPGVERQAVGATRASARRRGTGPIGLLTSAIYRASGRLRASADPRGYLAAWRGRGSLARAGEVVRAAITTAMPSVAPGLRGQYAAAARAGELEERIGASVDRVIAGQPPFEPPSSRLWPVLGLLQTANTVLLVFAAAWTVIWIIARPEVASYTLPVLGPMPAPLVLLAIGVIAGYVLARVLATHAGLLGRRWARRASAAIKAAVAETVAADAFGPIGRLENARSALAGARSQITARD